MHSLSIKSFRTYSLNKEGNSGASSFTLSIRAARCTENIGASMFTIYGSGFDSGIPNFGSVRTLHCAIKTPMVAIAQSRAFPASRERHLECITWADMSEF